MVVTHRLPEPRGTDTVWESLARKKQVVVVVGLPGNLHEGVQ